MSNPTANFNKFGKADYDRRTIMAPPGTPRWYTGEPKLPPKTVFKLPHEMTSLWLIRVVVSDPRIEANR